MTYTVTADVAGDSPLASPTPSGREMVRSAHRFTITADFGKPHDIPCQDKQHLREELVKLKEISQQEEHAFFDVYIRDEQGRNISRDEWVQKLLAEVLEVRA